MVDLANRNGDAIRTQQVGDRVDGAQLAPLLERIRQGGGGRTYAGLPDNWGATFTVGAVPVYQYLESQDIDEVGYTLRTASLMTDPEYWFDQTNPGDYTVFGVRYLLLPTTASPPVPARRIMVRGRYSLWEVASVGYVHIDDAVGTVTEDRSNVGLRSIAYLHSTLPEEGRAPIVRWSSGGANVATRPSVGVASGPAGTVLTEDARLDEGAVSAVVRMARPGLVVLASSYDPGWRVTVDAAPAATVMVAPAVVGVRVAPGVHRVVFRYAGFGTYPLLIAIFPAVVIGLGLVDLWRRRARGLP